VTALLCLLLGAAVGLVVCLLLLRPRVRRASTSLAQRWQDDQVAQDLEASLRRSRSVLRGQMAEQLVPLFDPTSFPCMADARFLGKPVDFIVFDGYSEVRAGRAEQLREVVFVDVKTGKSRLSPLERRIKSCVEAGRVRSVVIDAPDGPW
jgi:predicted Holliday junction resolvase-like endonuclease